MTDPSPNLFASPSDPACRVTVILPAKNEEVLLPFAIAALARQRDDAGRLLEGSMYEVLVLLNNCSDGSREAVRAASADHPRLHLVVEACTLAPAAAHAGAARRLLMDAATARFTRRGKRRGILISTDADTEVAEDWVYQNCAALDAGADAVGGSIELGAEDCRQLAHTDPKLLLAYKLDRRYQSLVARLESLIDPDPHDPWPRHLDNFGASLACTTEIYVRAGGMPAVTPLEDVAFVQALRRAGARLRHAPEVRVRTSARLDGRACVGLSWQLRQWKRNDFTAKGQRVPCAAFLTHRLRTIAALRRLHARRASLSEAAVQSRWFRATMVADLLHQELSFASFLERLEAERVIEQTFHQGRMERDGEIGTVIAELERITQQYVRAHRAGTAPPARSAALATLAG